MNRHNRRAQRKRLGRDSQIVVAAVIDLYAKHLNLPPEGLYELFNKGMLKLVRVGRDKVGIQMHDPVTGQPIGDPVGYDHTPNAAGTHCLECGDKLRQSH